MDDEIWDIIRAEHGTEGNHLLAGWEPFAVVAHQLPGHFNQSKDIIYLRKKIKRGALNDLSKRG